MFPQAGLCLTIVLFGFGLLACAEQPALREWTPADHAYPPGLMSERAAPSAPSTVPQAPEQLPSQQDGAVEAGSDMAVDGGKP